MISVAQALAHIDAHALKLGGERVAVGSAIGRRSTEDVPARLDLPPFAASGMDGYALSGTQATYRLIGEAAAGSPFSDALQPGDAVRISTGAVLPDGADRVVLQENVSRQGGQVSCDRIPKAGANMRERGTDVRAGEIVARAGTTLGPAQVAIIASAGLSYVSVHRRPRIAIFSSGNELRPVGAELSAGQIYAANALALRGYLERWGCDVVDLGIAKDTQESVAAMINAAGDADIIVPIGGASVGDHDMMRPSFAAAGFAPIFAGVAVKPGKPLWMASRDGQIVLGLPGNPASVIVCAHLFLRPLLGLETEFQTIKLRETIEENGPRETYLRGRVALEDTTLTVAPFPNQESFRLRPQADANALIRLPPLGGPYRVGDKMDVILPPDGPPL